MAADTRNTQRIQRGRALWNFLLHICGPALLPIAIAALAFALMVMAGGGCATGPAKAGTTNHGIPNLQVLDAARHIVCGGQPTVEGFQWCATNGITRDLKLNELSEGSDAPAKGLGIMVLYFPMSWFHQLLAAPEQEWMRMVVGQVRDGTIIHCQNGWDRTRLVIACWRLSQGWTKQAAEAEMLRYGFHKSEFALWQFWLWQRAEDWRK